MMSKGSMVAKFLLMVTAAMTVGALSTTDADPVFIFNEAKASPQERSRLWCRRLAYANTALFPKMFKMPEYGGFPNLPELNEDNIVADLAKFQKAPHKRNDPWTTMNCPPWWRVYLDGYGGQESMGGESVEGAVGGYLFVCCSTGLS